MTWWQIVIGTVIVIYVLGVVYCGRSLWESNALRGGDDKMSVREFLGYSLGWWIILGICIFRGYPTIDHSTLNRY